MQNFNSTVGFQQSSSRQAESTAILQQQKKQQQQQRFNQRRHFGAAKQIYSSSTGAGNLGNGAQAHGKPQGHRGSLSETMRIFERSQHQQQQLQHQQQQQPRKQPVSTEITHQLLDSQRSPKAAAPGATPSTGVLPPLGLEAPARRSNASSGQKPTAGGSTVNNNEPTAVTNANVDANQNYLPIITTSRSDGGNKLTGRQQQQQHHQSLTAAAAAASAASAAAATTAPAATDVKSETGAEPPTVRPSGKNPQKPQQQHLPPPQHPPPALLPSSRAQQQQQQANKKSATNRRRRVKGVGASGAGGGKRGGAAAASAQAKRIPVVYFSQENGSVHSGRLEDVDSRSCDMRHPNDSIAYGNVLEYIRDNQLMSSRKAKLIWAWIRDLDAASSSRLFVYDPNLRWYSLPSEAIGNGDV